MCEQSLPNAVRKTLGVSGGLASVSAHHSIVCAAFPVHLEATHNTKTASGQYTDSVSFDTPEVFLTGAALSRRSGRATGSSTSAMGKRGLRRMDMSKLQRKNVPSQFKSGG